ncbi:hypothetical protein GCM10009836_65630 [Pseudonocardia ailaonensis]|uniref:ARB-07466-like C-terminal domain-containing protein n=1 Tax=Pseudonocardia ailaonensis TaxID=367279 RepID=A0ABN2NNU0_9PSEU
MALTAGGVAAVVAAAIPSSVPAPVAATGQAAFTLADEPESLAATPRVGPPPVVDVDSLAKAASTALLQSGEAQKRVDAARSATEARAKAALAGETVRTPAPAVAASCGMSTANLGAVKPWVSAAVKFLGCRFGQPQTLGVGSRGNASDHPSGLAADFMVNRSTGDALAACALRNKAALGISYVIWQQRINYGSGWQMMEDRGGATANHMDHVHISFASSAPGGTPTC